MIRVRPSLVAALMVALIWTAPIDAGLQTSPAGGDPLARAIADMATAVANEKSTDQLWTEAKATVETNLKDAQTAMAAGRRWFALERLAQARQAWLAIRFTLTYPAERANLAAFERQWTSLGTTLGAAAPTTPAFDAMRPAALRALAEIASPQVRINYDAALEYGRNTQPEYGLYYLGVADAQRQFITLARTLTPSGPVERTPPLRSIAADIAAVQADLLAMYQPPASVDRHSEFIVASSALKEARQYDAQGLRYGALVKFLQGAQRTAMLHTGASTNPTAVATQIKEFRARVEAGRVDHSIALLFLERAETAIDLNTSVGLQTAAAMTTDVLPRYFAAIEPPPPVSPTARPAAAASVTVTLVRWPFT